MIGAVEKRIGRVVPVSAFVIQPQAPVPELVNAINPGIDFGAKQCANFCQVASGIQRERLEAGVIDSVGVDEKAQVYVLACAGTDIPGAAAEDTRPLIIADLRGHGRATGQDYRYDSDFQMIPPVPSKLKDATIPSLTPSNGCVNFRRGCLPRAAVKGSTVTRHSFNESL